MSPTHKEEEEEEVADALPEPFITVLAQVSHGLQCCIMPAVPAVDMHPYCREVLPEQYTSPDHSILLTANYYVSDLDTVVTGMQLMTCAKKLKMGR